ncbi:hypothetical protein [Nocardia concava]|uniref:hypothetical protein n=1 Tax=Nocardia concava TaxID=257281 RepID=UPI000308F7D4|nr:hypothetical protein [Nocardia concava]
MSEQHESLDSAGVWHATRELRRWTAVCLAGAGFLAWGVETLRVLANSLWLRDASDNYLGDSVQLTFDLMALWLGVLALILGGGVFLLLFRLRVGRMLVIAGSMLVLLAQLLSTTVVSIPTGASYKGLHPTLLESWPLMIFPLLTIGLLLGAPHEY